MKYEPNHGNRRLSSGFSFHFLPCVISTSPAHPPLGFHIVIVIVVIVTVGTIVIVIVIVIVGTVVIAVVVVVIVIVNIVVDIVGAAAPALSAYSRGVSVILIFP